MPQKAITFSYNFVLSCKDKTQTQSLMEKCFAQDRPRSAADQMGFGEREVGRTRMSVEEQLERMRRNQQASTLREKRRETPSRSPSFNKDNPFVVLQVMSTIPPCGLRKSFCVKHFQSVSVFKCVCVCACRVGSRQRGPVQTLWSWRQLCSS